MTDVYIVALSGYGTEEDRRKSMHAGFDSHLVKPLDPAARFFIGFSPLDSVVPAG